jgi:hypothetical protein
MLALSPRPLRLTLCLVLVTLALASLTGCEAINISRLHGLASPPLRFRADGTFKIVTFGDIHWDQACEKDQKSLALMGMILDAERPDLIVYTGDNCLGADPQAVAQGYRDLTAPAVQRGIPWAVTLGNHDGEKGFASRQRYFDLVLKTPGTVARRGPQDLHGASNYVLPIASAKNRQTRALLYCLDSNAYAPDKSLGDYDWIHPDQVQWYRQTAAQYKKLNHGHPLPAYAFFHIPLPEYDLFWAKGTHVGECPEGWGYPQVNSGLLAAILDSGDIKGVFVGHNHMNTSIAGYQGLWLGYVHGVGFNGYGNDGKNNFKYGARVIELREGQRAFRTWLRIEGNEVVNSTRCP